MQTATQILEAIRKLGEQRIPLTRVYRSLYSEDLFFNAYGKIRIIRRKNCFDTIFYPLRGFFFRQRLPTHL